MSSLYEAFMADILENPEDDTPRLVFADWLEEVGTDPNPRNRASERARAEFIRLQIAYEQAEKAPVLDWPVPRRVEHQREITHLVERESALLKEWESLWRAESYIAGMRGAHWKGNLLGGGYEVSEYVYSIQWRRGFVDSLECIYWADWIRLDRGANDMDLSIGPGVVIHHPIQTVRIAQATSDEDDRGYYWYRDDDTWREDGPYAAALMPTPIFDIMAENCLADLLGGLGAWLRFATEEDANEVLSDALLTWAKGAAKDKGTWPLSQGVL